MIDLDRPAPDRVRRRPATVRGLVPVVVGSLVAGVLLGGVATYAWRVRPLVESVEQDKSKVSLVLFAESGALTVDGKRRRVRLDAQVTVVNAGPGMVDVRAVRVDQPGVTVRSPERERQIGPGTALPLDVVVDWACGAGQSGSLDASVSVEPEDEQPRTVSPVALDATTWVESTRPACGR
ncbi:hypothetical protein COUCH_27790 [Couchioplanes caeruleus]|uniref:hypothetical protein n=1 Tax=Couchioplanes caeruleus TaxID=56438 RepID=UPI0020C15AC4|nr:hypothetical protein [Couchioplanes caeruleus]UQU62820.1 hypothetical protein COUCH_27790 [Couchioplanes caeruleus]